MNNTIQYKGYVGSVEFSEEDGIFYGKVMGIRSLISYEGESARELLDDFHDAVDDYLETCKAEGKEPEVAFEGSFNIRLSPDLHKKLFIYTTAHQMFMATLLTACGSEQKSSSPKQEEVTNQQTAIEEKVEEQPTTIEEVVVEVEGESTPEPTEEPTPEPTPKPTAEPVEMVSWEEWASQPGEEEPHSI